MSFYIGFGVLQSDRHHRTYYGVVTRRRNAREDGRTIWYCAHTHTSKGAASQCAREYDAARQAAPVDGHGEEEEGEI